MRRCGIALLMMLAIVPPARTHAAQLWTEGTNFELISPAQPTSVGAGKVEVLEVFSFGCPACNRFQPVIAALEKSLPANAQMAFLPASFLPDEDWVVFQRGFFAAQALGIEARTHQAIYDAIWETGELQTIDSDTHRLKHPLPSIEDVAKTYERLTGVKAEVFLASARSPAVDARMKAADARITAMRIPGTPGLVVNGKYRIITDSLQDLDDLTTLVRYLVDRETKH